MPRGRLCIHGHCTPARSPTYQSWLGMRARCTYPSHERYRAYGGRGITFDPRWNSFEAFLLDMGERPLGHTLDRIDPDGPYTLTNCRWLPATDNKRRY